MLEDKLPILLSRVPHFHSTTSKAIRKPLSYKETTSGEFRVYRASFRLLFWYIDLL